MKIRTQLVLACFVLSVLPLTGIVLYSYHSSRKAVEAAYRREAQRLTRNMDGRLATIRAELDERMASLSAIQIPSTVGTDASGNIVVDNIIMAMGEAAPLLEGIEYIPTPGPAPTPPPEPQIAAAEEERRRTAAPIEVFGEVEEAARHAAVEPLVIDLPPVVMPRYEMTPAAHAAMGEVGRLSAELAQRADKMTKDERDAKKRLLKEKSLLFDREIEASRAKFQTEMKIARDQLAQRRKRRLDERSRQRPTTEVATVAPTPATPEARPVPAVAPVASVRVKSELTPDERKSLETKARKARLVLGRHFNVPVERQGEIVGQIRAQLKPEEVIRRVLGGQAGDRDEIPFALDRDGNIYTRNETERKTLERLGIVRRIQAGQSLQDIPNWIVVNTRDEESGLRVGVARPVGENLVELRQTAARNFGYGMGLIAFALIGIVPLANHFTRDVKRVTVGAERIAQGDLLTRLPVRGNDEFGQLALAFNRMAEDLSENQRRLVEEERARREQEVSQRLLEHEYQRKSTDLEDARRFQLSMLPKEVPQHDGLEVAVFTQTATEVGGDYYDFHDSSDGSLAVTIGDATGHGARAGTMVTVIKTLFSGYDCTTSPASFLSGAAETIKRMDLGRMAMALSLARFEKRAVTVATAGMPPMLIHRGRENRVDEVTLPATPLGTLGVVYTERSVDLAQGDTVLLMSDGFPELLNCDGQQLGYPAAMQLFADACAGAPDARAVIESLSAASRRWHGDQPPNDDITFVVVRVV
ncbi:MAG TPA: SpoIIE family protein phosphatase [Thermoanaerobaculia bacterium]|nr:SpoIIE family protein phosphatase [Thermoanaerobaculia bacterium]